MIALLKTHLILWGPAYLKYFALLAVGFSPVLVGFFNGQSFEWTDWGILAAKLLGVFGSVSAAFVDSTYSQTKTKNDP